MKTQKPITVPCCAGASVQVTRFDRHTLIAATSCLGTTALCCLSPAKARRLAAALLKFADAKKGAK